MVAIEGRIMTAVLGWDSSTVLWIKETEFSIRNRWMSLTWKRWPGRMWHRGFKVWVGFGLVWFCLGVFNLINSCRSNMQKDLTNILNPKNEYFGPKSLLRGMGQNEPCHKLILSVPCKAQRGAGSTSPPRPSLSQFQLRTVLSSLSLTQVSSFVCTWKPWRGEEW